MEAYRTLVVLSRAIGERRPLRYANMNTNKYYFLEAYRSGHNGPHSKCGYRAIGTRVRIPSLPPKGNNTNTESEKEFVLFFFNDFFGIKVQK